MLDLKGSKKQLEKKYADLLDYSEGQSGQIKTAVPNSQRERDQQLKKKNDTTKGKGFSTNRTDHNQKNFANLNELLIDNNAVKPESKAGRKNLSDNQLLKLLSSLDNYQDREGVKFQQVQSESLLGREQSPVYLQQHAVSSVFTPLLQTHYRNMSDHIEPSSFQNKTGKNFFHSHMSSEHQLPQLQISESSLTNRKQANHIEYLRKTAQNNIYSQIEIHQLNRQQMIQNNYEEFELNQKFQSPTNATSQDKTQILNCNINNEIIKDHASYLPDKYKKNILSPSNSSSASSSQKFLLNSYTFYNSSVGSQEHLVSPRSQHIPSTNTFKQKISQRQEIGDIMKWVERKVNQLKEMPHLTIEDFVAIKQTISQACLGQIIRQISQINQEWAYGIQSIWEQSMEVITKILISINNEREKIEKESLSEISRIHKHYQQEIKVDIELIQQQKEQLVEKETLLDKVVKENRFLRRKEQKIDKDIKIVRNHNEVLQQEYAELLFENLQLQMSNQNMSWKDVLELKRQYFEASKERRFMKNQIDQFGLSHEKQIEASEDYFKQMEMGDLMKQYVDNPKGLDVPDPEEQKLEKENKEFLFMVEQETSTADHFTYQDQETDSSDLVPKQDAFTNTQHVFTITVFAQTDHVEKQSIQCQYDPPPAPKPRLSVRYQQVSKFQVENSSQQIVEEDIQQESPHNDSAPKSHQIIPIKEFPSRASINENKDDTMSLNLNFIGSNKTIEDSIAVKKPLLKRSQSLMIKKSVKTSETPQFNSDKKQTQEEEQIEQIQENLDQILQLIENNELERELDFNYVEMVQKVKKIFQDFEKERRNRLVKSNNQVISDIEVQIELKQKQMFIEEMKSKEIQYLREIQSLKESCFQYNMMAANEKLLIFEESFNDQLSKNQEYQQKSSQMYDDGTSISSPVVSIMNFQSSDAIEENEKEQEEQPEKRKIPKFLKEKNAQSLSQARKFNENLSNFDREMQSLKSIEDPVIENYNDESLSEVIWQEGQLNQEEFHIQFNLVKTIQSEINNFNGNHLFFEDNQKLNDKLINSMAQEYVESLNRIYLGSETAFSAVNHSSHRNNSSLISNEDSYDGVNSSNPKIQGSPKSNGSTNYSKLQVITSRKNSFDNQDDSASHSPPVPSFTNIPLTPTSNQMPSRSFTKLPAEKNKHSVVIPFALSVRSGGQKTTASMHIENSVQIFGEIWRAAENNQIEVSRLKKYLPQINKTIGNIYSDQIRVLNKGDQIYNPLHVILYEYFIHQYGLQKIAQSKLMNEIQQILILSKQYLRCQLFKQLLYTSQSGKISKSENGQEFSFVLNALIQIDESKQFQGVNANSQVNMDRLYTSTTKTFEFALRYFGDILPSEKEIFPMLQKLMVLKPQPGGSQTVAPSQNNVLDINQTCLLLLDFYRNIQKNLYLNYAQLYLALIHNTQDITEEKIGLDQFIMLVRILMKRVGQNFPIIRQFQAQLRENLVDFEKFSQFCYKHGLFDKQLVMKSLNINESRQQLQQFREKPQLWNELQQRIQMNLFQCQIYSSAHKKIIDKVDAYLKIPSPSVTSLSKRDGAGIDQKLNISPNTDIEGGLDFAYALLNSDFKLTAQCLQVYQFMPKQFCDIANTFSASLTQFV